MLIIKQLQQLLKPRRKNIRPSLSLLTVISDFEAKDATHLSLNQKGIIVELMSKVCLNEHQILMTIIQEFQRTLVQGRFGIETKSTVKQRASTARKGNTTTLKKNRNESVQAARNIINLEEMLDQELSSEKNHELKSNLIDSQSKNKNQVDLTLVYKYDVPEEKQIDFITPLKQSDYDDKQQSQEKKFEEYRDYFNISTAKPQKKKQNNTKFTKTKKKNILTIPEQMNTYISINNISQTSIKKDLQNILQLTKKKKNIEKEDFYSHSSLLNRNLHKKDSQVFSNLQKIAAFYIQNFDNKYLHRSQNSNLNLLLNQNDFEMFNNQANDLKMNSEFKSAQINNFEDLIRSQIQEKGHVSVKNIFEKKNFSKVEKSTFFFFILCQSQFFTIEQQKPQKFGEIYIHQS